MKRSIRLCTAAVWLIAAAAPGFAGPPAVDRFGDPLPEGAIARLGTIRYRVGAGATIAAVAKDGSVVACSSASPAVIRLNPETGQILEHRGYPSHEIRSIGLSSDGEIFILAKNSGVICVVDRESGKELSRGNVPDVRGIYDIEISPNRRRAVVVQSDSIGPRAPSRLLLINDLSKIEAKPIRSARGPIQISRRAFSPDGRYLAFAQTPIPPPEEQQGDRNSELIVWDCDQGAESARFALKGITRSAPAFSPTGALLAVSADDDTIHVYDLAKRIEAAIHPRTGAEALRINDRENPSLKLKTRVECMTFSPDGASLWCGLRLFSEQEDNVIFKGYIASYRLDNVASPTVFAGEGPYVNWIAFDPDKKSIFTFEGYQVLGRRRLSDGKSLISTSGHKSGVGAIARQSGNTIVSSGLDLTLRYWDLETCLEREDPTPCVSLVHALLTAREGKTLVALGFRNSFFAVGDGQRFVSQTYIPTPADGVRSYPVEFGDLDASGTRLALAGRVWNVANRKPTVWLWENLDDETPRALSRSSFFTPDGGRVISCASGFVTTYDASGEGRLKGPGDILAKIASPEISGFRPQLSPNRRYAAVCVREGATPPKSLKSRLKVIELLTGKPVFDLPADAFFLNALAFSGDGRSIAQGNAPKGEHPYGIELFDIASGASLKWFEGHPMTCYSLVFLKDDSVLASASEDSTILLWDIAGSLPRRRIDFDLGENLEDHWAGLASEDAAKAFRAIDRLSIDRAVPFLREKLKPLGKASAAHIEKLIADLASRDPNTSAGAASELERIGLEAEVPITNASRFAKTPETRAKAQGILDALRGIPESPDLIRNIRAMTALENIAGPGARELLEAFAAGPSGSRETAEAKSSLAAIVRKAVARHNTPRP